MYIEMKTTLDKTRVTGRIYEVSDEEGESLIGLASAFETTQEAYDTFTQFNPDDSKSTVANPKAAPPAKAKPAAKKQERPPAQRKSGSVSLAKERANTIFRELNNPAFKTLAAKSLGEVMTSDRFITIAYNTIRTNQKLMDCSTPSLMGCLMKSAELGLVPGINGHAYLVPFKGECTLIVGYQGFIQLAFRSGIVSSIFGNVVYANDKFEAEYGLNEKLRHVPCLDADPGKPIAAYAICTFKDGTRVFNVIRPETWEDAKSRSASGKYGSGPWKSDPEAMICKTAIRRLKKFLPQLPMLQEAIANDEAADLGLGAGSIDVASQRNQEELAEELK
jgi:recombination protein RecT